MATDTTVTFNDGHTITRGKRYANVSPPTAQELSVFISALNSDSLLDPTLLVNLKRRQALKRDLAEIQNDSKTSAKLDYANTMRMQLHALSKIVPPVVPIKCPDNCRDPSSLDTPDHVTVCFASALIQLLGSLNVFDDDSVWRKLSTSGDSSSVVSSFANFVLNSRTCHLDSAHMSSGLIILAQNIMKDITVRSSPGDHPNPLNVLEYMMKRVSEMDDMKRYMCFDTLAYDYNTKKTALANSTYATNIPMVTLKEKWMPQRERMMRDLGKSNMTDLEYAIACNYPSEDRDKHTYEFPCLNSTNLGDAGMSPSILGDNFLWAFHLNYASTPPPLPGRPFTFPYTLDHDTLVGTLRMDEGSDAAVLSYVPLTDEHTNWRFVLRAVLLHSAGHYIVYTRQDRRWWRMADRRVDDITQEIDFVSGLLARQDCDRSAVCALYYEHWMTHKTEGYYAGSRWVAKTSDVL